MVPRRRGYWRWWGSPVIRLFRRIAVISLMLSSCCCRFQIPILILSFIFLVFSFFGLTYFVTVFRIVILMFRLIRWRLVVMVWWGRRRTSGRRPHSLGVRLGFIRSLFLVVLVLVRRLRLRRGRGRTRVLFLIRFSKLVRWRSDDCRGRWWATVFIWRRLIPRFRFFSSGVRFIIRRRPLTSQMVVLLRRLLLRLILSFSGRLISMRRKIRFRVRTLILCDCIRN